MGSIEHLSLLDELLKKEEDYERATYSRSLRVDNISGRVCEADCKYPITINGSGYNALNQLILTISYETDGEELENDFEPGQPATFFYLSSDGTSIVELPHLCFVDSYKEGVLQLQLPNKASLASLQAKADSSLIGIRAAIDDTSYRVMHDSLRAAMRSSDEKFVRLRETLIGNIRPRFRQLPPVSVPWLNASQNNAIRKVVAAMDVAIVHGPPGTGKTTTLVEAIFETLQRETQVLVCAPSNAAVDWISEQLSKRGLNVLRIGNPLKMSDEMLACSYERRYADHPDYPELWNIRRTLRDASASKPSHERQNQLRRLRKRQMELEIKINADLFEQASVVSCTLIGSAYHIMEHRHFGTLFIDEAAQALEPACWTAILKADRVILGGDHNQLPPTVKCVEAARNGLANTLMQHISRNKPECVTLLDIQYRMHRDIMEFPSRWFYHGRLHAAPEVADRQVHIMDTPLTWIDTGSRNATTENDEQETVSSALDMNGNGERKNRTGSISNSDEAKLVVHTLRDYVDMIGLERIVNDNVDFGIISPYRAQVRLIRRLLKMQRFYRRIRQQVSVHTVDGFQGQERDVIIISMVRDNDEGQIGFLGDLRRMNVAITRARMKLIVIGNSETLSKHRFYNALFEHFQQHGEVLYSKI
ncbi:MAG: AAA family ATPase [Bacteroidales bacterium]|nr:AAA family ATPase [Bacteroidales bacterium]